MSDNTTITEMTGGDSIATDDIGGVKYQRVKVVLGADGDNDGDVSSENPLPVSVGFPATQPVSAASLPLPSGAATESGNLSGIKTNTDNINLSVTALRDAITGVGAAAKTLADIVSAIQGTLSVSGPLTDDELRAADVPVTLGGENVSVTGTFWQNTQPVSGPLTNTELRAADLPITLDGESVGVTGPLTDAQLRNSDVKVTLDGESVPVTGTFWQATQPVSGPLTDAQLRAASVGVTDADLYAMLERLLIAMQSLQYPPWLDRSANAIRNQVQSGTVTTVTTVTTVSAITSLNAYNANQLVQQNNVNAWATACRARIT